VAVLLKTAVETQELVAVARTLQKLAIPYQGPYRTVRGRVVFLVEDQIVLDTELVELFSSGKLNPSGVSALLGRLRSGCDAQE